MVVEGGRQGWRVALIALRKLASPRAIPLINLLIPPLTLFPRTLVSPSITAAGFTLALDSRSPLDFSDSGTAASVSGRTRKLRIEVKSGETLMDAGRGG